MAGSVGAVIIPLDERRRRRHDLLAELREVDHWRRLVAARLDLAVAALTDSPTADLAMTGLTGDLREVLREVLGLPNCDDALPEARILLRLRATLRELDQRAEELRTLAEAHELTERADGGPHGRRSFRTTERIGRESTASIPAVIPPPSQLVTRIRPRAVE